MLYFLQPRRKPWDTGSRGCNAILHVAFDTPESKPYVLLIFNLLDLGLHVPVKLIDTSLTNVITSSIRSYVARSYICNAIISARRRNCMY